MKQLKKIFRTFCLFIIALTTPLAAYAAEDVSSAYNPQDCDSVEVSLLTCSPHEEIYSLYGHTALRWHDLRAGSQTDLVFNWGVFSFKTPHFVLRFVFGLTDYELGVVPMNTFMAEYKYYGSSITEQVLDLTVQEKQQLLEALGENLAPENRVYRYNFFYDNCSTRPRDMVEKALKDEKIVYQERKDYQPTYREMVHQCVRNHPWAAFGNDMLLGVKADLKTNRIEQEFLPENLLYDFDRARVGEGIALRPLVKERRMVVRPGVQVIEEDFPLTPMECALLLALTSLIILLIEYKQKTVFRWWDILLMTAQGAVGLVLTVMLFSQHPTTSTNLQLLLFNPVPLFFIPAVFKRRKTIYWLLLSAMALLFFIGSLWQDYAEGMEIVALCLLLRYVTHRKDAK